MTSEDTEKKIDELQTSRDYTTLMELAHFDEIEITRNMALFAIGELSHDENDEGTMDRTVDFLSQTIHQDIFPTIFGEFESFSPFGYFEGGTFSMAAAQLAFLPQWNKKFQTKKINDYLKIDTFITLPVTITEINFSSNTIHNTIIPTS